MEQIANIVYKIRSSLRQRADDSGLSNRLIFSFVKASRNLFLKQELDKRRLYRSMQFQLLKCVEMEPSSLESCCGVDLPATLFKSTKQIPQIIDNNSGLTIQGVYPLDGSVKIHVGTLNDVLRKANGRVKTGTPQVFFDNQFLYLYNKTADALRINAIFEDPEVISFLNVCKDMGGNCDDVEQPICINYLETDFPFPGYLEDLIIERAVENILASYFKVPPDQANDSRDD